MTGTEQIIILELSPMDANLISYILSRVEKLNQMEKDAAKKFIIQTAEQTSDELFDDILIQFKVIAQLHNLGIKTSI